MAENKISEKESIDIITNMIHKVQKSYNETGYMALLWGSVIIVCSLVTYLQIMYSFSLPINIWLLTVVAIIPQIFISVYERKYKKIKTYYDVAIDNVWLAFGISMGLLIFGLKGIESDIKNFIEANHQIKLYDFNISRFTISLNLMLYGFPTLVTGTLMKCKPMIFGAVFCWIGCAASIYTETKIDLLIMAAAAFFAWFLPGIILYKNYRISEKK